MLRAWLGFGEENRPSSRERGGVPRDSEKTRAAKLFFKARRIRVCGLKKNLPAKPAKP